jgi:hypothetical protein
MNGQSKPAPELQRRGGVIQTQCTDSHAVIVKSAPHSLLKPSFNMSFSIAFWHVLNFFAPALGVALWASCLTKWLWWRSLRGVAWWSLFLGAFAACGLALIAGLFWFGADGKMATYGFMVGACALVLWWRGFVRN